MVPLLKQFTIFPRPKSNTSLIKIYSSFLSSSLLRVNFKNYSLSYYGHLGING
jgi:hypothetical protein